MKMKTKERLNTQGFTLVELLVAMAVSLLAVGAIYSTFLSQFKSYQIQEEIAAMHCRHAAKHQGCNVPYAKRNPNGRV